MSTFALGRRAFLRSLAAGCSLAPALRAGRSTAAPGYTVGVGHNSDPYQATMTAVAASGQFPSVTGKTVIIKPNLVIGKPSTTGVTTDPQVVRAIVDLALAQNPKQIVIAEGSCIQAVPWGPCGYNFFTSYANPTSLIELVDLTTQGLTTVNVSVSGGLVCNYVWLPVMLTEPNVVFISVAKLKTHESCGVSLSTKNLIGIVPTKKYAVQMPFERQDLHYRGIDEAVLDVLRVRPIQFAVIDGIWGMQGEGPTAGTPIQTDLVFAGLNSTAVDVVALNAMQISQSTVPFLLYVGALGVGPTSLSSITVKGDPYTPVPFIPAVTPPVVWRPAVSPNTLAPGQTATIAYKMPQACYAMTQIIQDNDIHPGITVVRTLQDWTMLPAGTQTFTWDGTGDNGLPVPPGTYLANVQTQYALNSPIQSINFASAMITVTS